MKNATAIGFLKAGALAGAILLLAGPSVAQRSRGSDSGKDDSRPVSRPETRSESRPAPRIESPSFRAPSPSPSRDTPRFTPAPSRDTPRFTPAPTRDTPRFTPAPREMPRYEPVQRSQPVDSRPTWRGSSSDRTPDNNGGVRPTAPTPRPDNSWRATPSDSTPVERGSPTTRRPDNGGVRPSAPVDRTAPSRRGNGSDALPGRAGRGGGPDTGTLSPRQGSPGTKSPQDIQRNGNLGRRIGSPIADGGTPPVGWRPPSRNGALGGTLGSPNRGSHGARENSPAAPGSPAYRSAGPGGIRNVPTGGGWHPPVINRDQWRNNGRDYGGRHFYTIDLGWYDPWYCYNWGGFNGIRFYYPYYYCGPYVTGYYYSPFWCYGSYFPIYIYPERVVYIERRVYIHDVVDDDYDLYDTSMQSSMRDTMDDIKAAWLDGDGGRLLDHINQAIPIRIYQKGVYKYSLEPDDFRDVSKDALNRVNTTDFEWTNVDKVSDEEVHLEARHTFRDSDGEKHVIRLTYTLEKARGGWWITETGTGKWDSDI